jgi:Tfp pilus assembly protein PilN
MKAVNLIPTEDSGNGSSSGIGVYALLGGLAVLVVMSALYTLAGRSVDNKRSEVAAVTAQADAAQKAADSYKPYIAAADGRKARVETVKNLADSRFDWSNALREVARTLPRGAWITSMRATVSPAVAVDGATDSLRASLAVPALEMSGCAPTQARVADVLASLRAISGVQRVSLSKSERSEDASEGTGQSDSSSGSGDGCGAKPGFSLTVFYEAAAPGAGTAAPTGAGATAAATSGTASTTAGPTAGASTTTGGTTP